MEPASLDWMRTRCGRGFSYRNGTGETIRDRAERARLARLAIPPAWEDVRIASDTHAHIQAVGRDQRGRLQYLYHRDWAVVRDVDKQDRVRLFGRVLPRIRQRIDADLRSKDIDRTAITAAAVRLLSVGLLRPGHPGELGEEGGRGAATLLKRHVDVTGSRIRLRFRAKGRRLVELSLEDGALARVLEQLAAQRGSRLFKEGKGRRSVPVTAQDLNAYLREASGAEVSAKDFRTFFASARAIELFAAEEPAAAQHRRRSQVLEVCRDVSATLHNTPAIARSSYILPSVLQAFEAGAISAALLRPPIRKGLSRPETGLMRHLEQSS